MNHPSSTAAELTERDRVFFQNGGRKYAHELEFRAQRVQQRTEQIENGCNTLFRELFSNRCDPLKRRVVKRSKEKPDARFFDGCDHLISGTSHRDSQFFENISAS